MKQKEKKAEANKETYKILKKKMLKKKIRKNDLINK